MLSKGFVIGEEDHPAEVWKAGIVLCTGCGNAVQEARHGSMFVTTAELQEMVLEEDNAQQERAGATVRTLPASAPIGTLHLTELAAHFNAARAESTPETHPASETPYQADVPRPAQEPTSEETPAVPSNKAALLATLRAEAQKARAEIAQTQQLLETMASLPAFAKKGLLDAIKKAEKQAASYEAQAAKLLEPAVKYTQSAEMVALRKAIYLGGIEALQALDAAIATGLLGKKSAPKKTDAVATAESQAVRVADAERTMQARKENTERNAAIEQLYREGASEKTIRTRLGLTPGTVTGVIQRAVDAGRLVRHTQQAA